MIARFSFGNRILRVPLDQGVDISLPVDAAAQLTRAWHAPPPVESPILYDRPASVSQGFSVNSFQITLAPHSHCTHTEWCGHFLSDRQPLPVNKVPLWMPALLLSLFPRTDTQGQSWLTREDLQHLFLSGEHIPAVIVRTLPNSGTKRTANYSGQGAAAFEPEAMSFLREEGVCHLLTDLPSVDPEKDGGALRAHRTFLNHSPEQEPLRTITELVYVPDHCRDGLYVLNLQLAPIPGDAVPSRPIIFPSAG
ncbi:MAG: cyclase family protein [Flavobacteriales bacterium]|nr:cyclase family protein [Flavobacteriales bacterium]MCX7767481.1 cyclase family protein [Flavobacteriales bacterium]MDW8409617.1 cyclase family protein [Flavobacteriales bacterium]